MRWAGIIAGAAAGAALLVWLFPRYESGARSWQLAVSREQVVAEAAEVARENGIEIGDWHYSVGATSSPEMTVTVSALSPGGDRSVSLDLDEKGRLKRYLARGTAAASGPASAEEQAQRMFVRLAGDDASRYQRTSSGSTATGSTVFTWDRPTARIKVEAFGGHVVSASRTVTTKPQGTRAGGELSRGASPLLNSAGAFIGTVGICVACWIFFSRLGRRTRHVRLASRVALAVALCLAVTFLTGNRIDGIVSSAMDGNMAFSAAVPTVLFGMSLIVLMWLIGFGAGFALLPEPLRPQWLGAGALAQREWFSRRTGEEVLAGLLLGLPLACIPYLVPATGLFPEMRAEVITPRFLLARTPWASTLFELVLSVDALALVCLWLPLGARWLSRPWQWLLGGLALTVPLTATFHQDYWSGDLPRLSEGVLLGLTYLLISRYAGVIGLGASIISSYAVLQAWLFLSQPSAALVSDGKATFLRLAIAAAVAALWAWKGKPLDETATLEQLDPAREDAMRTEHDRLLGEFSVARKAQEGMLPDHPPEVAGYDLVALCRPALEVGGDLYDWQRLPDGRLLFCVADVSGKGVTAALYMTLTKGLLAALARHHTHASEIVTELNRHLYRESRRKTFVTMVLGILDPATGAVELVRAGHNPAILCRPSARDVKDIHPRGLGLALTAAGSFRAQLDTQKLHLEAGDSLICYSDGLPETMNPVLDQYGEERIRKVAAQSSRGTASELRDDILESVDRFRSGADPHDDLTLLIVRALPTAL